MQKTAPTISRQYFKKLQTENILAQKKYLKEIFDFSSNPTNDRGAGTKRVLFCSTIIYTMLNFSNNFFRYVRQKTTATLYIFVFLALLISGVSGTLYLYEYVNSDDSGLSEYTYDESCNVIGIELRGDIYTYVPLDYEGDVLSGYEDTTTSENVMYALSSGDASDNIQAILIEVDSYGGSPAAAEEIMNAIKHTQKPVVAFVREGGLSAAYYAITPADRIFALKNSDIGSIGVTMSYVNNVFKNQQEGLSYVQLATGKFKDAGSPDRPLTQEDRNLFMRDLQIIHENFIQAIVENRSLPLEQVRALADGSSVLGEQAKELGLIDEIGGYAEATGYLSELLGEEVEVCW